MNSTQLLILDDDLVMGEMIQDIAAKDNIRAKHFSNFATFFDEVERLRPSHILIDLRMSGMDGLSVMRQLGNRACHAALIISSGVDPRVLEAAARAASKYGLNVVGVLPKPFRPGDLLDLLGVSTGSIGRPVQRKAPAKAGFDPTPLDVARALEREELEVFYQPKVECLMGRLTGFEALARWRHPEHGLILPDKFIPVAEAGGLMKELTEQVLERSLACLSRWSDRLQSRMKFAPASATILTMAVNMSAQVLQNPDFVDRCLALCGSYGIAPERITMELTESCLIQDAVDSLALLTRLRVHGFDLSFDDFGTCYSSLKQLLQFPFSEIKIDKSFVMHATQSGESRSVIGSVVSLAQSLGLRATAEGVEDLKTLGFLRSIKCDLAQGYLISQPAPEAAMGRWLSAKCTDGYWSG